MDMQEETLDDIIIDIQQEVSNLTTPTTLAGPQEGALEELDIETVTSDSASNISNKGKQTRSHKNPEAVASIKFSKLKTIIISKLKTMKDNSRC
jgi:hypothetical protein